MLESEGGEVMRKGQALRMAPFSLKLLWGGSVAGPPSIQAWEHTGNTEVLPHGDARKQEGSLSKEHA